MAKPREEERLEQTEYLINELAIAQAIVGKIVSGVGFLALTWSTVVLLGGFVGALQTKEFWCLTTVSLVLASTTLTFYNYNLDTGKAVLRSYIHLIRNIYRTVDKMDKICFGFRWFCRWLLGLLLLTMTAIQYALVLSLIYVVSLINTYGSMVSMIISMMRLIQHDYDGSDAASKGKLRAALFMIYCLALVHGMCFYGWFVMRSFVSIQLDLVSMQCGFGGWGSKVIREYFEETNLKCAKGLRLPAGWNLVAYAVGLLDSVSRDDNLSGVRMLGTFVATRKRCIRLELLSSRRAIQNLITMLGWTSPTPDVREMRERAARIMAEISSELQIARFPGALQCVSSLLEASPQKRHQEALGSSVLQGSEQSSQFTAARGPNQPSPSSDAGTTQEKSTTDESRQWTIRPFNVWLENVKQRGGDLWFPIVIRVKEERAFKPKGTKELIFQGLLILERLAYDEHNCKEIVNTQGLLSKITAPITSQAFLGADCDDTWVSILCSSLRAVSRLITAPGEAGTRLRHEISASKEAVDNMLEILEGDSNVCKKLKEHAIEILTEVALGPTDKTEDFVKTLERIFLQKSGANRLRRKAGEALAKLLSTASASGLASITEIFCESESMDASNVTRCDILLTKIMCIILSTKIERKADEATRSASGACACAGAGNDSVIEINESRQHPNDADQNKPTEQNDEQSEERKLVVALLSLTVVICDRSIDANYFCSVVPVEGELVEKLKNIIDRNKDMTADCLRIVKLTCQVVIAMIKVKPSCIKEFNEHNFKEVLSEASKTLSDLDNCMLFSGNDRELTKPARSLASLVKEAHQLFN